MNIYLIDVICRSGYCQRKIVKIMIICKAGDRVGGDERSRGGGKWWQW